MPTSSTGYTLSIIVATNVYVSYIHFTIIIYNDVQITNSKKYRITSGLLVYTGAAGGSTVFPNNYDPYIVVGVQYFIGSST